MRVRTDRRVHRQTVSKGLLGQSLLQGDGRELQRRKGPLPKQVLAEQLSTP